MDPILVSYSLKPLKIGSRVRDFTICVPVEIAAFVIFCNAVTPTIPRFVNRPAIVSTAEDKPEKLILLLVDCKLCKLLADLSKFKADFSLSKVLIVVFAPCSNLALSNCI